jgi:hypothetical protein
MKGRPDDDRTTAAAGEHFLADRGGRRSAWVVHGSSVFQVESVGEGEADEMNLGGTDTEKRAVSSWPWLLEGVVS